MADDELLKLLEDFTPDILNTKGPAYFQAVWPKLFPPPSSPSSSSSSPCKIVLIGSPPALREWSLRQPSSKKGTKSSSSSSSSSSSALKFGPGVASLAVLPPPLDAQDDDEDEDDMGEEVFPSITDGTVVLFLPRAQSYSAYKCVGEETFLPSAHSSRSSSSLSSPPPPPVNIIMASPGKAPCKFHPLATLSFSNLASPLVVGSSQSLVLCHLRLQTAGLDGSIVRVKDGGIAQLISCNVTCWSGDGPVSDLLKGYLPASVAKKSFSYDDDDREDDEPYVPPARGWLGNSFTTRSLVSVRGPSSSFKATGTCIGPSSSSGIKLRKGVKCELQSCIIACCGRGDIVQNINAFLLTGPTYVAGEYPAISVSYESQLTITDCCITENGGHAIQWNNEDEEGGRTKVKTNKREMYGIETQGDCRSSDEEDEEEEYNSEDDYEDYDDYDEDEDEDEEEQAARPSCAADAKATDAPAAALPVLVPGFVKVSRGDLSKNCKSKFFDEDGKTLKYVHAQGHEDSDLGGEELLATPTPPAAAPRPHDSPSGIVSSYHPPSSALRHVISLRAFSYKVGAVGSASWIERERDLDARQRFRRRQLTHTSVIAGMVPSRKTFEGDSEALGVVLKDCGFDKKREKQLELPAHETSAIHDPESEYKSKTKADDGAVPYSELSEEQAAPYVRKANKDLANIGARLVKKFAKTIACGDEASDVCFGLLYSSRRAFCFVPTVLACVAITLNSGVLSPRRAGLLCSHLHCNDMLDNDRPYDDACMCDSEEVHAVQDAIRIIATKGSGSEVLASMVEALENMVRDEGGTSHGRMNAATELVHYVKRGLLVPSKEEQANGKGGATQLVSIRDRVVKLVLDAMTGATLNKFGRSNCVGLLMDLKAVETKNAVRDAFRTKSVDPAIYGDYVAFLMSVGLLVNEEDAVVRDCVNNPVMWTLRSETEAESAAKEKKFIEKRKQAIKIHNAKVLESLRAQQSKRDATKKSENEKAAEKEPAAAKQTFGTREKDEEEEEGFGGEEVKNTCSQCSADDATMACGRCKRVYYCGRECQRLNWGTHKQSCKEH